jgi:hypothetical protein
MFRGQAQNVPVYCCGNCGAALIEGVHAKQFVDGSRPVDSLGARVAPLGFDLGDYLISATVTIPTESNTLVSLNGPLVVTCGRCQKSNEVVAPNQLFDE